MSYQENRPGRVRPDNQEFVPTLLPAELADFLARAGDFACLTYPTDHGTAYVIKTPETELDSLQGAIPIGLHHSLYAHPRAPVIRTVLSLHDRARHPLRVESFINIADPLQRADFAALAEQEQFLLLFFDREVRHRLSKLVPYPAAERAVVADMVACADALRAAIPAGQFNYERAKAAVLQHTTL